MRQHHTLPSPGGEVRNDTTVMSVRTARLYAEPEDFDYLVVRTANDGTAIYLKDVAQVYIGAENENSSFKSNGIVNLSLGIVSQSDANPLQVAAAVRKEVDNIQQFCPKTRILMSIMILLFLSTAQLRKFITPYY